MKPLVKLEGLVAGYGKVSIVRDVDLEVGEGEVVALLGPNGAGKTTTILTMAGELAPLGGVVRCLDLDGKRVAARAHPSGARPRDRLARGVHAHDRRREPPRVPHDARTRSSRSSPSWRRTSIGASGSSRAASSRCSRWAWPSRADQPSSWRTNSRSDWRRSSSIGSSPCCVPQPTGASGCCWSSNTSTRPSLSPTASTSWTEVESRSRAQPSIYESEWTRSRLRTWPVRPRSSWELSTRRQPRTKILNSNLSVSGPSPFAQVAPLAEMPGEEAVGRGSPGRFPGMGRGTRRGRREKPGAT